jgi:hypothetical protein
MTNLDIMIWVKCQTTYKKQELFTLHDHMSTFLVYFVLLVV